MIDKNTVFIIGAGGSYPYGFPLGIELRSEAYSKASSMFQEFHNKMGGDYLNEINNLAQQFSRHFKVSGDQSIDWFLKKFPEYGEVGKFLILDIILQAENDSKFLEEMEPDFKSQDWYWYLYTEMSKYLLGDTNPGNFLNNKISFITFNYDRSLEHFLHTCFTNGHSFKNYKLTPSELFKKIVIKHVYGQVAPLDWQRKENQQFVGYKGYHQSYDLLDKLKGDIKLIDERNDKKNYEIGNIIMNAERIFFLGFSYADENLEVLEIPKILNKEQWVYGTVYGMTENEMKKIRTKFSSNVNSEKMHFENIDCLGLLRKFL